MAAVIRSPIRLSFCGEGGETLGEHGYSKDYRPDLKQTHPGSRRRQFGHRPICTEMWPGNTAEVTVLLPVINPLASALASGGCAS
jgi:transposase